MDSKPVVFIHATDTKFALRMVRLLHQDGINGSKQLAICQRSFDEIQLADRKERVMAMQELFEKIPDIRVDLKLKILAQIRAEVGQDHRRVSSVQAASRSRASRTI